MRDYFAGTGSKLAITYSHEGDQAKGGRAAGKFHKLEEREGRLWADEIDWTPTGAREVADGEWGWISAEPLCTVDKEGNYHPRRLSVITLTNKPAVRGMATVQLAAEDTEAAPTRLHDAGKEKRMKKFAALLGLAETASDEDIEKALTTKLEADKVATEKLEAEKKAPETEKGVIEELTASVKELRSLKAELVKLQADRKAERVAKAIATAKLEGKVNKDNEANLVKLATSDVETFEGILPTLAVVAPVTKRIASGPSGVKLEDVPNGEPADINTTLAKLNAIADENGISLSEARQYLDAA